MTDSAFRGPVSNLGAMMDSPATIQPEDGPSYAYQGNVFSNLRGGAFNKDGIGNARVPAYLHNNTFIGIDNVPSAAATTILSPNAVGVTSGTPFTLISVAPGNTTAGTPSIATGLPFIPFGASAVQNVIALDFGFTTGTTTAAASTIVVVDNTQFYVGQWIAVGGAGNAAKTLSLLTQVQSIVAANTTGITVSPVPLGALTNAPIGSANLWNQFLPPATQFGPGTPVATAVSESLAAGLFRIFNPLEGVARNVCVASITAAAGGAVTVRGWDIHHQAMSETLTVAAGTGTIYGKKAFKFIGSVTPGFSDTTGSFSVGIGDTFGFALRNDRYEYSNVVWGGVPQANATGFLKPDLTSPATATTGDVRGTVQVSSLGAGTPIAATPVSNGVLRLFVGQDIALWNMINGTPVNTVPMFGQTQFTN